MKAPSPKTLLQVSCLALAFAALQVEADDARAWLDRMNRAVEDLNYEGTFVHVLGGNAETMYIVHRNHDGMIGERLVSLDGAGREIIREQGNVQVIMPDRKMVLIDQHKDAGSLVKALPTYSDKLEPHYSFTLYHKARVANRSVQVVGIKPKDRYRYGYMLWLDRDTAMPLKWQTLDENGHTIEQILFTQIDISDFIPASALQPTIDTKGFKWYRSPDVPAKAMTKVPWRVATLPGGFVLSAATESPIAGSKYPVEHLVFSDGIATVSVFIEDPKTHADVADGFSHVGSTNTYSLTLSGRKVTAMGDVPKMTVHAIATSLMAE